MPLFPFCRPLFTPRRYERACEKGSTCLRVDGVGEKKSQRHEHTAVEKRLAQKTIFKCLPPPFALFRSSSQVSLRLVVLMSSCGENKKNFSLLSSLWCAFYAFVICCCMHAACMLLPGDVSVHEAKSRSDFLSYRKKETQK